MSLTLQLNCWINYPIWYTPYLNTATIWLISEFNLLASLELTEYLLLLKLWKPLPSSHFFSFVIFHEYQTKRWICIFISNNYNNIFFEFSFFFLFFYFLRMNTVHNFPIQTAIIEIKITIIALSTFQINSSSHMFPTRLLIPKS